MFIKGHCGDSSRVVSKVTALSSTSVHITLHPKFFYPTVSHRISKVRKARFEYENSPETKPGYQMSPLARLPNSNIV